MLDSDRSFKGVAACSVRLIEPPHAAATDTDYAHLCNAPGQHVLMQ
jgi:hypothetical protein